MDAWDATLMSLQNRKARPVPLEQYEDYGDIPPEGMDLEEVELIWWTVAPRLSKRNYENGAENRR